MKMGPGWDILEGGASETRSWHFGPPRPFRTLILVRPRTNDCRPSSGGEHAGETGVSLRPSRWLPRPLAEESCRDGSRYGKERCAHPRHVIASHVVSCRSPTT